MPPRGVMDRPSTGSIMEVATVFAVLDDVVACAGTDDPNHDAEDAFVDARTHSPSASRGVANVAVRFRLSASRTSYVHPAPVSRLV